VDMPIQCPECQTMNRKTNNFCKKCGCPLPKNKGNGGITIGGLGPYKDPFSRK